MRPHPAAATTTPHLLGAFPMLKTNTVYRCRSGAPLERLFCNLPSIAGQLNGGDPPRATRRGPSRPAEAPHSSIQRERIPWPLSKAVRARYARFEHSGLWHEAAYPGCPLLGRALEGKRTTSGHRDFGAARSSDGMARVVTVKSARLRRRGPLSCTSVEPHLAACARPFSFHAFTMTTRPGGARHWIEGKKPRQAGPERTVDIERN